MSVISTLYIGRSGMRSNETAIDVIGNNIANVNTIGYKSSRAAFADVLSQTMLGSAGTSQAGLGSQLASVQRLVEQGALLGTNVATDLAVNGNGLFMVSEAGSNQQLYTRNGQFQLDDTGYLTTVDGLRLQGYLANDEGVLGGRIEDLNIGEITSSPSATTRLDVGVNLDAEAKQLVDDDDNPISFDPLVPEDTSNFSTSATIYDSLGSAHQVQIYFSATSDGNQWEWHALIDGGEIEGETAGTNYEVATGTISFNQAVADDPEAPAAGTLLSQDTDPFTISFNGGVSSQDVLFSFGDPTESGGTGKGSTRSGAVSATNSISQDGYPPGNLQFIDIGSDGVISGTFDNAQVQSLGQVALATFQAPHALESMGRNYFAETLASGDPAIGAAGSGGRGDIYAGSLEQSNVDLAGEFTELIVAQRGFQAASRTITTADEMLIEVVNLKR